MTYKAWLVHKFKVQVHVLCLFLEKIKCKKFDTLINEERGTYFGGIDRVYASNTTYFNRIKCYICMC